MGHLTTPTGKRIVATVELIPGTCPISDVGYMRGSPWLIDQDEGTEVNWNGQKTVEVDGQRLFVDEAGAMWLENTLTYVDED